MTDKALSIIVPCWKLSRKPFWPYVLKSIQETNPYQIILINNSPKDPLNKALRKLSNVLVLEPGRNIGAAAAWNLGFNKSRGQCVLFSADDIILHPQAVWKAVSLISKDVPFVYGDYGIIRYENGKLEVVGEFKSRPFDREMLLEGIYSGYVSNYIDAASPMRRDIFPGFDTTVPRFIDWDMISRIVKAGHSGSYLPGPMFDTIVHPHRGISRDDNSPIKALARIRRKWDIHLALSRNQRREIELRIELLKLYYERGDLRRLFPEVAVGDLRYFMVWAERLSWLSEHEAWDLAYLRVRPFRNLLTDGRNRSAEQTRIGGPMARLLVLYKTRRDLQSAYPEVQNGEYSGLLLWAKNCLSTGIDSSAAEVADLAGWYGDNEWLRLQGVKNELESIRSSFSYRVIRSFTSRINRMFPDGTKRGELRKRAVLQLKTKTRDDTERWH